MRLLFCLFAVALLWSACSDGDNPTGPDGSVTVTTDQSTYASDEAIHWDVTNHTQESVWYGTCPGYTLERREAGQWQTATEHIPVCVAWYTDPMELEAHAGISTSWANPGFVAGTYRIGFVLVDPNFTRFSTVYSDPFEVR